jgi:hypothetical protein
MMMPTRIVMSRTSQVGASTVGTQSVTFCFRVLTAMNQIDAAMSTRTPSALGDGARRGGFAGAPAAGGGEADGGTDGGTFVTT